MKCYVTSRFKNATENKAAILSLCSAVGAAGLDDSSFIRDIEQFNPKHFATQKEVWQASLELLKTCDCLLIDVSDTPTGGRNVEAGMAYALNIPIIVVVKEGISYKSFYDGIASLILTYSSLDDITKCLKRLSTQW